jgi:D-alanyl-lipoteichoic acid acyltransferase DltB (MBOAT superfamily)
MLFNSPEFIFAFLPATLAVFFLLGKMNRDRMALGWLVVCSLFFYGWWDPRYLALIGPSIAFNYIVGTRLSRLAQTPRGWRLLAFGVTVNLALLGWFKYANFAASNLAQFTGLPLHLAPITLPMGISFFTFTQIAFLVDAYRGYAREFDARAYTLFVTYFPHLVAGPIIHHKDVMPQFKKREIYRFNSEWFALGVCFFAVGLFKKVALADNVAAYARPVFEAFRSGVGGGFFHAWGGALAYTAQIYFDFSGYSDMAIGLSAMLGVRLPVNFNSPYQAVSIIDFWRRWHITLSTFLRDYLYIPLGGNRHGHTRRYVNIFVTMLLGGIWHGAGWTFILWGALHGVFIVVNHAFQHVRRILGHDLQRSSRAGRLVSRAATFLCVVLAWVFFRSDNFHAAFAMVRTMGGAGGVGGFSLADVMENIRPLAWIFGLLLFAWTAPNSQQVLQHFTQAMRIPSEAHSGEASRRWWHWRPGGAWPVVASLLFLLALLQLSKVTEFLYFQF